jgi:UV DNA damage endonuclease
MEVLTFNAEHNLLFFRITSDLIPFASHPVCIFPWQKEFKKSFQKIGTFIKKHNMRVSMHPDQFTLINSLKRDIFIRSTAELKYHADLLNLMGTDHTAKIQIHVGGAYGNKEESMKRFIRRFRRLPVRIKRRLVIENDDRSYSVKDCVSIHRETGIPIVFDTLHHKCNSGGKKMLNAFSSAHATWKSKDGPPVVDYSIQDRSRKKGAHAMSIHPRNFNNFLKQTEGFDFDIMCEIKDKEKSALKAAGILSRMRLPG